MMPLNIGKPPSEFRGIFTVPLRITNNGHSILIGSRRLALEKLQTAEFFSAQLASGYCPRRELKTIIGPQFDELLSFITGIP